MSGKDLFDKREAIKKENHKNIKRLIKGYNN